MFPTSTHALQALSPLRDHHVTQADLDTWTPGVGSALLDAGFLVRSGHASRIPCPACSEIHDVEIHRSPTDSSRFFVHCPDAGFQSVDSALFQQYRVDHHALINWFGTALGSRHAAEALTDSAWCLPRISIGDMRFRFVFVRDIPEGSKRAQWDSLGLTPRTVLLSFGPQLNVPDYCPDVALSHTLWAYLDEDDDTHQLISLVEDLIEVLTPSAPARKPKVAKTATKQAGLDKLRQELVAHIRSSQDTWRKTGTILPRPEQKHFAKLCDTTESTISRRLKDSSPLGHKVQELWAIAEDEYRIQDFNPLLYQ
jgi:hypothetical protein